MIYAMTYEQAQKYIPAPPLHEPTLITGGERVRTAPGWQFMSRSEFGFSKPDRSWKRHRRSQRASLRI